MEYGIEKFLSDTESLVLRLCRLMTTFDETVAVMPCRQSRVVSRYNLWLEDTDEKKTVALYVGGVRKTEKKLKLFLRHRAVMPDEIAEAEEILQTYTSRLSEVLSETDTYRVNAGRIYPCETDESVWDFCAEFKVYEYETDEPDGVSFYVSFGHALPVHVGAGCTAFCETVYEELYTRRFFDENFYRSDVVGEKRKITFEFETDLARCALYPILLGEKEVRVIKALDTGEAESAVFTVEVKSVSADTCTGSLILSGKAEKGRFDLNAGTFLPDKTERRDSR